MTLNPQDPGAHADRLRRVEKLERLANLMDSKFTLPATNINLGLDTLIGLVPVVGDTAGLGVSGYIVWQGRKLGARKRTVFRMLYNIFIDWLIGLIPIIGDIFDVGWKANNRNAALIRRHVECNNGGL